MVRFSIEASEEPRTAEGDFILADKLIDAWLINRGANTYNINLDLKSDPDEYIMDSWTMHDYLFEFEFDSEIDSELEPFDFHLSLQLGLALSAIIRGDGPELQSLIDRNPGVLLPMKNPYECRDFLNTTDCTLFESSIVAAAAEFGNADIMRVLVANQHKFPCTQILWFRGRLAAEAVRHGNREGLKVLIEGLQTARVEDVTVFPSHPKKSISHRMRSIFLTCFNLARLDIADDILNQCEAYSKNPDLHFDILMQAIKSGSSEAVRYALKKASALINHQTKAYNYQSPLCFALYYEWKVQYPCMEGRIPLIRALLENGADPSQIDPKTKKSILEHVIMRRDHILTILFINHEKKLGGMSSVLSCSPERQSFWLRIAVRWKCQPLIDLLLDNTVVEKFVWRRTEYLVQREDLNPAEIIPENKETELSIRGFQWERTVPDGFGLTRLLRRCFYISPMNSRKGIVIHVVCECPWCTSVAEGTPRHLCELACCLNSRSKYIS